MCACFFKLLVRGEGAQKIPEKFDILPLVCDMMQLSSWLVRLDLNYCFIFTRSYSMPLAFLPGRPVVQLERDNIMDWKRSSIKSSLCVLPI